MKRYLKLFWRFVAVSFSDDSVFRFDFFTSILHYLIYQAIFIIFWKSLLTFTADTLGDWTFPELAILSTFALLASAIMEWFAGFLQLPEKVLQGDLDKYLCRPISPLFALLAEEVSAIDLLQQLFSGTLIVILVAVIYEVPLAAPDVFAGLGFLFLGCLAMVLLQGCISMLSFWLGDINRIHRIFWICREFERYPVNLFPLWLRNALTWLIPVGLITTYPTLVFLGKDKGNLLYFWVAVTLVFAWSGIFAVMWRKALRRYESFGG